MSTFVTSLEEQAKNTKTVVLTGITPTVGNNLVVMGLMWENDALTDATNFTVTDDEGNTYTYDVRAIDIDPNQHIVIAHLNDLPSYTTSIIITVDWAGAGSPWWGVGVFEYSGDDYTLEQSGTAADSSTPYTGPSSTNDEIAIGVMTHDGNSTAITLDSGTGTWVERAGIDGASAGQPFNLADSHTAGTVIPVWSRATTNAVMAAVVYSEAGSGAQDITPPLVQQLAQPFGPAIVPGLVDMVPALKQQLTVPFDPTLDPGSVNLDPALKTQLASSFDPSFAMGAVALLPSLKQQLSLGFDPVITSSGGTQDITPALLQQLGLPFDPSLSSTIDIPLLLKQQLALGFNPSLSTGAVDISPAIESQLMVGFDPSLGTGAVDIAPALSQQLAASFDPGLSSTVDLIPGIATELVNAFGPAIAPGSVDMSPALAQQIMSAFDPSFQLGASVITPALVQQLITAFSLGVTRIMILPIVTGSDDGYGHDAPTFDNTSITAFFGSDGDSSHAFFRFALDDNLVNSTIEAAFLHVVIDGAIVADTEVDIYADDSDDPDAPTDWTSLDAITPTTAKVKWTYTDDDGGAQISPDIKTVIQELVDSYGPLSTEHMVIVLDGDVYGTTSAREINTFESTETEPQLHISFLPSAATQNIALALISQLAISYDPTITTGAIAMTPGLLQALASAFDPTLTFEAFITPAKEESLIVVFDPVVAPGAVFITPALLQQLLVASDPSILGSISMSPDIANQLVLVYDPIVALSQGPTQDMTPDLIQQFMAAIDPAITGGVVAIEPGLLQKLIGAYGPTVGGDDQPGATTTMSDWSG